jgi:Zn-finger nucleic acid-binding protein
MMEKRPRHFGQQKFFIDRCQRCNLIWLDAGELAKLQLKFETGDRGLEQEKMIARRENMTPEEKKEFEERIDHLPEYRVFKHMFGTAVHHDDEESAVEFFDALQDS